LSRIRRKLEELIINKYTLELDYAKLGINLFVLCKGHIPSHGKEDIKKIEKKD